MPALKFLLTDFPQLTSRSDENLILVDSFSSFTNTFFEGQ